MYSDQSTTSTEIRNLVSSHTTVPNVTNSCYTMSQTMDGKPPSQHTKQCKLTCGYLLHPVNTDSGRKATIRTYIIQEALTACYKISTTMDGNYHPDIHNARGLDRLLQYQHRLWTETTILTYKIQEDMWPLAIIQVAEFRLKLPTRVGATTWTLNTKGSTAKYSHQYIKKYPFSKMGATIWT